VYRGAGFVVPVAGDIKLMPGTASEPAFANIDVDVENGPASRDCSKSISEFLR